jgi:hypothetical protein
VSVFHSIEFLIRAVLRDRAGLAVDNLALRQQSPILIDKTKRPKLRPRGRVSGNGLPGSGEQKSSPSLCAARHRGRDLTPRTNPDHRLESCGFWIYY